MGEIVKKEVGTDIVQSPGKLIALALDKNASPEILEKLLSLQERWDAMQARKQFVEAMTAFKKAVPPVLMKCDRVAFDTTKGRTEYNYANLSSIVEEITTSLSTNNLSASWETAQDSTGGVSVTCHITHIAGHRESVTLVALPDETGNKNKIQAIGSTVTYLERYTLLAALGLATKDQDDDGLQESFPGSAKPRVSPPQAKSIKANVAVPETISDAQAKRFYAIAKGAGWQEAELKNWMVSEYGVDSMKKITKDIYEDICEKVQKKMFDLDFTDEEKIEREPGQEG